METGLHKSPPEIINALHARIEMLEPQEASYLLKLLEMAQQKKISIVPYGEWTREEVMLASLPSLWKIWDNEQDAFYDTYKP